MTNITPNDSIVQAESTPESKNADGKNGFVHSGTSPTSQELLDAALAYARRGWLVFPLHTPDVSGNCSCRKSDCKNVGKHPRTMNGLKDATTDEAKIRHWWSMWETANVGVVTGAASGFVVLDVDPQHYGDKALAVLQDEYGELPETWIANTGGGGQHFFFQPPTNGLRGSVGKVGEGLDIRGDGNYIVAPPSLHKSGRCYSLANEHEIAQMPDWLLQLAETRQQPQTIVAGEVIPEGRRNNTLARFAGTMRRAGMSEPEIAAALLEVNKQRCEPPLDDDEVRAIAASISRYEPSPVVESDADRAENQQPDTKPKTRVRFQSATDLLTKDFPEPKFAVAGLLSEGVSVFAGRPKIGKSWLALSMAVAVASGGRALGSIPVEQGDVLYLALEDGERRLQDRLKKVLGSGRVPDRFYCTTSFPRLDAGGMGEIEEWLQGHPDARLVVIDTLKRVRQPDRRNSRLYDGDYDAVAPLSTLALKYGVSIMVIHHTRKMDSDDPLDMISGSTGLTGGVDGALVLKRARGNSDAELHATGRDFDEQALALKWDKDIFGWKTVGSAEEHRRSTARQEIVELLRATGTPMPPKDIATQLGKERGAIRKLVADMAKDGDIHNDGSGKYSLKLVTPVTGNRVGESYPVTAVTDANGELLF